MARNLSNISIDEYADFLKSWGCKLTRTKASHQHWTRSDLNRPITFQSTIDPVPEFIIKNGLRSLGVSRQEIIAFLEK